MDFKFEKFLDKYEIPVISMNTIIVGSGAAAFNAADSLYNLGQKDIAIITEGIKMGTSRNTGSDKQTYYKLSNEYDQKDSVLSMAQSYFNGGSMDGDVALVEAAMSSRCFFKLVNLGVPFPSDEYGQYIGYKTDHDSSKRATSCGPLTSKYMVEKLEEEINKKNIRIYDGYRVIAIIKDKDKDQCMGILAINLDNMDNNFGLTLFNTTNVIYATGGPSGLYYNSVYPESQTCSHGAAFEIGVNGRNLLEWQFGIASIKYRWNLSGSYQQSIPKYYSCDQDGKDKREFLQDYFSNCKNMINGIFKKGYQWPFDSKKLENEGSSNIDLAVYNEVVVKNRRVFIDYRENPSALEYNGKFNTSLLDDETYNYLKNCEGLKKSPIDRLLAINERAYLKYLSIGIDLKKEPLEISVCAQHNNGGLETNIWWESSVKHFFPVGEASGVFGVYRPGGSALNSTQVSSLRAAQYIAKNYKEEPSSVDEFCKGAEEVVRKYVSIINGLFEKKEGSKDPYELRLIYQKDMDANGGILRKGENVQRMIDEAQRRIKEFCRMTKVENSLQLHQALINRDILIAQFVYLNSIREYIKCGGESRGSYLIIDNENKDMSIQDFSEYIQVIKPDIDNFSINTSLMKRKGIPEAFGWFEKLYNKQIDKA